MSVIQIKVDRSAVKKAKRIGRGCGNGRGRYCGRGQKGQKARSGGFINPRFEGGQMPLYRRLPKRGFKRPEKVFLNIFNVSALNVFPEGAEVTVDLLKKQGIVKNISIPVKLLANGELKVKGLSISVNHCSEAAKAKIEELGGKVSLIKG
jgi:large subunit ribosomal protein L15